MSTMPGKKEPEDIFSGLDTGGDTPEETHAMDMEPEHRSSSMKLIVFALIIFFAVAGAGAAVWYFLIREQPSPTGILAPTSTTSPVVTAENEPVVETPPALPPEPETTTPPPNIPPPQSITTSTQETPTGPTPPTQPTEAADTDGDGLSDPEEAVLGTDFTMADSDGDGFTDGSELQNGYDPAATSLTITNSPRYRTVQIGNGEAILDVYLPTAWTVGVDTATGGNVIQTGTPTDFAIRGALRPAGMTFTEWLASNDPSADPSAMRQFTTRSGYVAHMSFDRLHSYVEVQGFIFAITYRSGTATTYDYRALYDYVVQTIRAR
jgi:hypothetical protein